jgi:hypothetical protein
VQDRYVGDIGDFGKYGLLRALSAEDSDPALSLGIVWYRVPDETRTNDGAKIGYLRADTATARRLCACDPELHRALKGIVETGARTVCRIRTAGIFPPEAVFYEPVLTYQEIRSRDERLRVRARWLERASEATRTCELVFLDPDNGLEVSFRPNQPAAVKYVYLEELDPYLRRVQSVIVYQHIGRQGSAEEQAVTRLRQMLARPAAAGYTGFGMLYHRGTCRVFLVAAAPAHRVVLERRLQCLLDGPWQEHFERISLPD